MDIGVLGVDLGKNVCSVVGLNASGAVVMRRRVRRETLIAWRRSFRRGGKCFGSHSISQFIASIGWAVTRDIA